VRRRGSRLAARGSRGYGRAGIVFGISLLLAAPAATQSPDARPLSLAEALEIAERNHPDLRRARVEVESSEADVRAARAAFFPDLSLSVGTGGSISRVLTGEDPFGRPERLDDPLTFQSSWASQSINLGSITLFDGGRRLRELRASQSTVRADEASIEAAGITVRAEVGRRYYDAQRTERLIGIEERALERARAQVEVTGRLIRLARASPIDLRAAEVTVADRELDVARARGEARKAMLALREIMGVMDGPDYRLVDLPPDADGVRTVDADLLVRRALEESPDFARWRAMEEAAEHRLGIARAARWPQLSTNVGFSRGVSAREMEALFEPNPLDQRLSFGFSLTIPLFQQYRTTAQMASARAARTAAEEETRAARLAVEREVRGAAIDLENASAAVSLAERAFELGADRLEMAEESYRIGAIDYRDVQDALEQTLEAERRLLDTRYEYARAVVALEELVGGELTTQ